MGAKNSSNYSPVHNDANVTDDASTDDHHHHTVHNHNNNLTHKHHSRFHKIKSALANVQFSVVGITQILLLLLTVILAMVFYTKRGATIDTLLIAGWEVTLEPCFPGETTCVSTQQGPIPPLSSRLNCSNSSLRTVSESSALAVGNVPVKDYAGTNGAVSLCLLSGLAVAYDHASTELFSTIDVIFLCMSSQVLATCTALVYMTQDQHKVYLKIAVAIQILYAICILFFQNLWLIPMNNIFIVEILLIASGLYMGFYAYNHKPHEHNDLTNDTTTLIAMRLLEISSSVSLLSIAVLGAAGSNTTSEYIITSASIALAAIIFIASKTEYKHHPNHNAPTQAEDESYARDLVLFGWKGVVFVEASWVALLPAIMFICIGLYKVRTFSDAGYVQRPWAIASLVFLFIYILAIQTVQSIRFKDDKYAILAMDVINVTMRYAILLCILIGALAALD